MSLNNMFALLVAGCVVMTMASPTPPVIPSYKYCDDYADVDSNGFGMECNGIYRFDTNGDHKVTESELYAGMKSMFHDPEYFRAYFLFRDLNQDGAFDEQDEPLVFDRMDMDHSGDVTLWEYFTEYQMVRASLPFVFMSQLPYVRNTTNQLTDLDRTGLENLLVGFMKHKDDGSVEKADFVNAYVTTFMMDPLEADHQFGTMDTDKDGAISTSEMAGEFDELDTNGDDQLDLNEIMKMGKVSQIHFG